MEVEFKTKVTQAFNEWLREDPETRSIKGFAREHNLNDGYVSAIKNGNYQIPNKKTGKAFIIHDKVFFAIADNIGLTQRSYTGLRWQTNNLLTIQKACKQAQAKRVRILLDGETGFGKTHALEDFSIRYNKVIYVKVTRTMTEKSLLDIILKKLDYKGSLIRGNRERINQIRFLLTGTPGYLLIVDEAEYLKTNIYHTIKEISDFTEYKCGFVLAGHDLITKIRRLSDKRREGFPQLRRRFFTHRVMLPQRIENSEKAAICIESGITNDSAIDTITSHCMDFDIMSHVILAALSWQNKHGRKITGDEIEILFKDSFDL